MSRHAFLKRDSESGTAVLLFTESGCWKVLLLELELFSLDGLHNWLGQRLRILLLDQGLNAFTVDLLSRGIVLLVLMQYNLVLRDLYLHKYAITRAHATLGQDSGGAYATHTKKKEGKKADQHAPPEDA